MDACREQSYYFPSFIFRGLGSRGLGVFYSIEDIHLYRFSCILVDIFAYYGSFAPKRHVDSSNKEKELDP